MQAVVGVVHQYSDALRIVEALRQTDIPADRVSVLSPQTPESALRAVPTTEAESPGIGGTIGSVVGGAAGTAGGLAVASLALPGVGPVIAAGALAMGLLGAAAGGSVGAHFDDTLSKGLPTDELYVYRHALRMGRTLVVATVDDDERARRARELMTKLGAESVDAAREEWWIGLRDAEEAEYTRAGAISGRTRRSTARDSTRPSGCRARPRSGRPHTRCCGSGMAPLPRSRPSARATPAGARIGRDPKADGGDHPCSIWATSSRARSSGRLDLVRQAARAERAGFDFALISDHFHPWSDRQGQSPFVWAALGAIAHATETLTVGTGVTCPIIRTHPAIVAHAAATVAAMMPGRFFLGVGTGENLNEHVTGAKWPPVDVRREMLEGGGRDHPAALAGWRPVLSRDAPHAGVRPPLHAAAESPAHHGRGERPEGGAPGRSDR